MVISERINLFEQKKSIAQQYLCENLLKRLNLVPPSEEYFLINFQKCLKIGKFYLIQFKKPTKNVFKKISKKNYYYICISKNLC